MTLLQMKGITKRFGSLVANEGVSLSVNSGEIHAVMGKTGLASPPSDEHPLRLAETGCRRDPDWSAQGDGFFKPARRYRGRVGMVHQTCSGSFPTSPSGKPGVP